MSEELSFFESNQRKVSFRGNYSVDPKETYSEYDVLLKDISIYDLAKTFKRIIEGIKEEPIHEIIKVNVSIDEQIDHILNLIEDKLEIGFLELVKGMNEKIRIVVTFIALLELTKMGKIGIKAAKDFNNFILYKIANG